MTKDEIEKLADEYVTANMKDFMEENLTYTCAFKAGYLKGVETERKRCLEICESSIKIHVYINNLDSLQLRLLKPLEESMFIKELIERGDK